MLMRFSLPVIGLLGAASAVAQEAEVTYPDGPVWVSQVSQINPDLGILHLSLGGSEPSPIQMSCDTESGEIKALFVPLDESAAAPSGGDGPIEAIASLEFEGTAVTNISIFGVIDVARRAVFVADIEGVPPMEVYAFDGEDLPITLDPLPLTWALGAVIREARAVTVSVSEEVTSVPFVEQRFPIGQVALQADGTAAPYSLEDVWTSFGTFCGFDTAPQTSSHPFFR